MSEYLKYRFEKICEEMRQFRIRGEQETEIKGTMKEVFQERSTVLKVLHSCDLAFFTSTFSFFFFLLLLVLFACLCRSWFFCCYKKLQLKFNAEGNIYVKHESRVLWLSSQDSELSSLFLSLSQSMLWEFG